MLPDGGGEGRKIGLPLAENRKSQRSNRKTFRRNATPKSL